MKVCNYGGNSTSGSCVIDLPESRGSVEPPSLTTSSMLCPQGATFRAFVLTPTPVSVKGTQKERRAVSKEIRRDGNKII